MIVAHPASRFADADGRSIYTKIERSTNGLLGPDLTWGTARGLTVWLGRWCFYLPLFFWRRLK